MGFGLIALIFADADFNGSGYVKSSVFFLIMGLLLILTCFNKQTPAELSENVHEVSSWNPVQSTQSRPRHPPIPYLRTISLPTYEMAVGTLDQKKKDQQTPPPQFHELHF